MNYPFHLEEISNWLRAKEASLKTADVDCSVRESPEEATKPSMFADFFGEDAAGRITGWVSGEFDFEVTRLADDSTLWYQHIDVTNLDDLEPVFADFDRRLRNPGHTIHGPAAG
jgi:hypothetical protein